MKIEPKPRARVRMQSLQFELDGPNVTPETINALSLLDLADAFFKLTTKIAESEGHVLTLHGVQVIDKCVAVAVVPSNAQLARVVTAKALRVLGGVDTPPRGAQDVVDRLQRGIRGLPPGMKARAGVGRQLKLASVPELSTAEVPWEQLELRVVPIRVGGKDPSAELTSASERASILVSTGGLENAQKLGANLYRAVDVVLLGCRNFEGRIDRGKVLEVHQLDDTKDAVDAWRGWFAVAGAQWGDVDDIEEALGRHN